MLMSEACLCLLPEQSWGVWWSLRGRRVTAQHPHAGLKKLCEVTITSNLQHNCSSIITTSVTSLRSVSIPLSKSHPQNKRKQQDFVPELFIVHTEATPCDKKNLFAVKNSQTVTRTRAQNKSTHARQSLYRQNNPNRNDTYSWVTQYQRNIVVLFYISRLMFYGPWSFHTAC